MDPKGPETSEMDADAEAAAADEEAVRADAEADAGTAASDRETEGVEGVGDETGGAPVSTRSTGCSGTAEEESNKVSRSAEASSWV